MKQRRVWIIALALLAVFSASMIFLWDEEAQRAFLKQSQAYLVSLMEGRSTTQKILIASLFIGIGNALLIPINALILVTAVLMPGWEAFTASMVGALIAAYAGYFYGKVIGDKFLRGQLGKKYEIITSEINKNALKTLILLHLVPLTPNTGANMLAGLCQVALWKLAIATLVGFLPGVIVITLMGNEMRAMYENPGYQAAIWLVALGALLYISYRIGDRVRKRFEEEHLS